MSFAVILSERIAGPRLVDALRATLDRYDFFYGELLQQGSDLLVVCNYPSREQSSRRRSPVLVDVTTLDESIDLQDRPALYRSRFVSALVADKPVADGGGRGVLGIKLTNYRNAAVLGLTWDHAVSDLHGMYAFIRDVSLAYNGVAGLASPVPQFDRRMIWRNLDLGAMPFDVRPSTEARNSIVSISRSRARRVMVRYLFESFFTTVPVLLVLDEDQVQVAKAAGARISTYDVVNAILLKVHAECSRARRSTATIGLYFPIDVRGLLETSERTIANCLGNASALFKLSDLRAASVAELAVANRAVVTAYGKPQLLEDIRWAVYWSRHTTPGSLYHHWLFGRDRVYSSNWFLPEIADLRFGDAAFRGILRSSQLTRWSLLPTFHSTLLPQVQDGRVKHLVRVSLRRSDYKALARSLAAWPQVREAIRLDTGERICGAGARQPARVEKSRSVRGRPG